MMRACFHVRTSRANKMRSTRSVLVIGGRFTCRLRMMSCCRRRAFSARSSDLLRPRSARVCSGKEEASGLVQRAKREESASKQPSFSRRRWVKIPAITKTSPSHENSVIRARGMLLTRSDFTPTLLCLQGGLGEFSLLKGRIFERMCQVASTGIAERSQVHKVHAIGEGVAAFRCHL